MCNLTVAATFLLSSAWCRWECEARRVYSGRLLRPQLKKVSGWPGFVLRWKRVTRRKSGADVQHVDVFVVARRHVVQHHLFVDAIREEAHVGRRRISVDWLCLGGRVLRPDGQAQHQQNETHDNGDHKEYQAAPATHKRHLWRHRQRYSAWGNRGPRLHVLKDTRKPGWSRRQRYHSSMFDGFGQGLPSFHSCGVFLFFRNKRFLTLGASRWQGSRGNAQRQTYKYRGKIAVRQSCVTRVVNRVYSAIKLHKWVTGCLPQESNDLSKYVSHPNPLRCRVDNGTRCAITCLETTHTSANTLLSFAIAQCWRDAIKY